MPAPLLVPLILLGGATVALAAASAKKKKLEPDVPPGTPRTYTLDAGMPPTLRDQVLAALTTEKDPAKLEAFAAAIADAYPLSAAALRTKEAMILSLQPLAPTPFQPAPIPVPPASVLPDPAPIIPPLPFPIPVVPSAAVPATPLLGGLDPGMPIEMQRAVVGALTTENDPAKLEGFASAIQAQYPISSGLLMAKAQALRLAHPSAPFPVSPAPPAPTPPVPIAPAVLPFPVPQVPSAFPVGGDSTRTGRNAGRPTGYPFILLRGESTYPAKIAQQATGSETNYPQMSKINPQFAKDGVHWVNIQSGDALNIPWDWAPKLAGTYLIEIDPGVTPPLTPLALPAIFPGAPSMVPALPALTTSPSPMTPQVLSAAFTGGTYTVLAGDFATKIAKKLTGNGNRWRELVAANPQKKTLTDGNFASLMPGEVLHLPASWSSAPITAALPAGGSNAAHA